MLGASNCSPASNHIAPSCCSPLTSVPSAGMSEGALTEMRSRLIAGLKRYFHGKRMEGLLSVQVRGVGGVGPAVGRRQPDDGGRCNTASIPCPRVLGCVHSTAPAPFPPPHHSDLLATHRFNRVGPAHPGVCMRPRGGAHQHPAGHVDAAGAGGAGARRCKYCRAKYLTGMGNCC